MQTAYETACSWHAGQWSALYKYMSSGIVDKEHQDDLKAEIQSCLKAFDTNPEHHHPNDKDDLLTLLAEVENWVI